MTTPTPPTTPIVASVGEPTPIPERPTLYVVIYPDRCGTSWKATRVTADARDIEPATLGAVLVTIPGNRAASPTAPRAEDRVRPCGCVVCVCNDDNKCRGCGAKSCATHASPPRDRCEVCGGTGTVLGLTSDLAVRHDPCPRCSKETPCESGSKSGSGSVASSSGATSTPASVCSRPTTEPTGSATAADAASDPATVAGEGPYRVEGKYGCITGMSHVFAPFNHHNLRDENDVPGYRTRDIVAWMNHAHRTALAGREAEVVRLRKALAHIARMRDEGCGCSPVCKCSEPASLEIFRDTVTDIARDALKGDAR
jgi:hypothetical protein